MTEGDLTEFQTEGGRSTSKKLSMQATAPPSDVPGYRLERFLGSGAFGQVWVGRDLNTGRPVAVKFFLHRGGVNWSLLSHEVKNLVQLSADRHIVQVLEVGWDNDPPYYVMELVPGGSLEDELTDRGALPVGEAVMLFRKICIGLNHSHNKGVLHCDLKPANILLGDDHEPRLADFGQSRLTHDQTPSLGTLFYMAPEQADLGSSPSSSWDVYAVGAIMYRMLTGGPPYRDDSIVEQLDTAGSLPKRLERYRESIRNATPPVRHIQRGGVDRELARIVSRCLAPEPDSRFGNVQEILDHLDRRDESRAKRPLMLLGILGPLLLLIVTSISGLQTINTAKEETMVALKAEARESNLLAARFAARTLESELERYFRLCQEEINSPAFREQLGETLRDAGLNQRLQDLADAGTSLEARKRTDVREALLDNESRQKLDEYLQSRLVDYMPSEDHPHRPKLATIFVTDQRGTIFSIAYVDPVARAQSSAGRNYAYRTYFHGQENDLPKTTPIADVTPLRQMQMSAAFQSTATFLWKIAISAPVKLSDDPDAPPDAVFVATINLGDIEILQGDEQKNHVAVLVDAREGPTRGTLLQHPYLDERQREGKLDIGEVYRVDVDTMDALLTGKDVDYADPVAAAEEADIYSGGWIAAMEPVTVPRLSVRPGGTTVERPLLPSRGEQSDLLVLVQYRLNKVFAPVGQMTQSLIRTGSVGLVALAVVSAMLWFFVRRVRDDRVVRRIRKATVDLAPMQDAPSDRAASNRVTPGNSRGNGPSRQNQSSKDTSKPIPPLDPTETIEVPPKPE
ncbi:serine/threonine-protein kinase [Roseiconus lacunae]|uniref:serine/threonine-protein kinase n=1 Tax=Roseiconus lacunae TaxID=2605694 RepID=UPI001358446A|nr:serine/threonine-protein kinase [Roseiconus lacunae]